ncbi:MAG: cellulase family glycosylhydrolase [Anaerolineales bacterium]
MNKESLKIGVNLGGWISQYKEFDRHHFDTFITEDDIHQIADWGFDHIRLPIDYPILEDDSTPAVYHESGFAYLDHCLAWCQDNGLRVVFDIHKAPGYSFTNTLEAEMTAVNTLFTEPSMQQRFVNLWGAITRRYIHQAEDFLAFELLNEIVLPESSPWNTLAQQTVNHIREEDPHRLIIVGGNNYNAITELTNIQLNPDPYLLHTFHFYEPLVVTHQKAPWVIEMEQFNKTVNYPGEAPGLAQFLEAQHPIQMPRYQQSFGRRLDKQLLEDMLQPAQQFMQQTDEILYCGEFGVINRAPMQTRINWNRDFIDILNENRIGYAYWSYKEMDFGLVDKNSDLINEELLRVITQQR